MADELTDKIKFQITRDSHMSAVGVKQLLDGNVITSASDRKSLASYLFYLHGRLLGCPPPPPLPPRGSIHS